MSRSQRSGTYTPGLTAQPRRRKSSSLGEDPRGDTDVGSIATNLHQTLRGVDPPSPLTERRKHGRERKRTKAKRIFRRWQRVSLTHTWLNPLILIVLLLLAYWVKPNAQNPLHQFIFLSYANPPLNERTDTIPAHLGNVTQYGKGRRDFAFVAFYTVVFTFTREFIMQRLLKPIAIWCGLHNRHKQARFLEQSYTAIYFGIFGPFGLWVMSRSSVWFFNTRGMFEGFPHRSHEAYFKAYYLLQASYWSQQAIVLMLQLEKPRKDFKELVLHHIITLALIWLSYRFHFTYMGIAVYITHDISDFFLATSKVLNYLDSVFTPPYFVFFIGVWAYTRHYLNLIILASLLPPTTLKLPFSDKTLTTGQFKTVGSYELNWDTQQYKCWISQSITFFLLAALQAVNIFWFVLIVRVLLRIVLKGEQKDERSDDEDEEHDPKPRNGLQDNPKLALNGEPIPPPPRKANLANTARVHKT
ncbi:longevity assurance proteins LAG1/LAC1 [Piedraia hortae CBS 480.64]|uniref:Longevity assurance proteins LAG1/LAC1 n=1 Tax=Piedraia hortae CBS 480.64 TaxID=1314780 RepID=A0A6A7C7Z5_9PEZI|nr:longevity assurance proteins LAG1/LAC1 [Piedraia hortae CBS 480.64]